jgi:hypothetical protein
LKEKRYIYNHIVKIKDANIVVNSNSTTRNFTVSLIIIQNAQPNDYRLDALIPNQNQSWLCKGILNILPI